MTTNLHPSTSLDLPNIIAKLALQSTSKVNMDGSTTFKFEGNLSSQSLHLVYLAAELQSDDGFIHETKQSIIYGGNGKDYTWSLRQAKTTVKAEKFAVIFTLNDYTIPAQTERIVKQLTKQFENANRWLELVLKSPWENKAVVVKDAIERVYYTAQCLADYCIDL